MSKFVFKRKSDAFYTDSKTLVSFTANELEEILEEFTNFLKGCGYELDGRVGIVTDEVEVNTNWDDMFSDKIEINSSNPTSTNWPWPVSNPPPVEDWSINYDNYGKDDIISLSNSSINSSVNLDHIEIMTMFSGNQSTSDTITTTNSFSSER